MNIPVFLTLLRILLIPVIVFLYVLPYPWAHPVAAIVMAVTAFTDWLDGYLARSLSQTTQFGAFLDPVADKLLIAVSLVMVLSSHAIPYLGIASAIIISREIAISALREWMSVIGKRVSVRVSQVAKYKAAIQMVALGILVWYNPASPDWFRWLGTICLYVAAILTVWSMCIYLKAAWPDLSINRNTR